MYYPYLFHDTAPSANRWADCYVLIRHKAIAKMCDVRTGNWTRIRSPTSVLSELDACIEETFGLDFIDNFLKYQCEYCLIIVCYEMSTESVLTDKRNGMRSRW